MRIISLLPGIAAALLAASPVIAQSPAPASHATLGEWLARDKAAAGLAPGEARSAELGALHSAVAEALQAVRAGEDAKRAAGQPRDACLPPPGEVELTSQEIGTWLAARPPAEHGESLRQVLTRFLSARFPCP